MFTADASLTPATQVLDCKGARKLVKIQMVLHNPAPSRHIRPMPPSKSVHGHASSMYHDVGMRKHFDWFHMTHLGHHATKAVDGHLSLLSFPQVCTKNKDDLASPSNQQTNLLVEKGTVLNLWRYSRRSIICLHFSMACPPMTSTTPSPKCCGSPQPPLAAALLSDVPISWP